MGLLPLESSGIPDVIVGSSTMRESYWGFSPTERKIARRRADGNCEFPAGCERPNTGTVNHITGSKEAQLADMDKGAIQDVNLNSVLLCDLHERHHDLQEQEHVKLLETRHMRLIQRRRGRRLYDRRRT